MNPKKKILIIYEFFYPAYKAGGVVQSLRNMVSLMHNDYDFYCITGGYDLNEALPLEGIELNCWNDMFINGEAKVKVWYDDKMNLSPIKWRKLILETAPDCIYINGFMHIAFLLNPLWVIQFTIVKNIKTIIAPRGMLQEGAVAVKSQKKKWYLKLIQLVGLAKNIHWHITSPEEEAGISKYFKLTPNQLSLVANIPQKPVDQIIPIAKEKGSLQLVYASIITTKKNLLYVLESLGNCTANIQLSIYGVIKEEAYWKECEQAINNLPNHIQANYKGSFKPDQMHTIVTYHDAMILMSSGENFSHAIFECLGAGRPIISSDYTSWNNLTQKYAGWNLPLNQPATIAKQLDALALMDNTEWQHYCVGAHKLALEYLASQQYVDNYKNLFG